MFTLDVSRTAMVLANIPSGPQGFVTIEDNGNGVSIVQNQSRGCYWMAVPLRNGGHKLYPMRII